MALQESERMDLAQEREKWWALTDSVRQRFSTAGPWYQLYRAARGSPGICRFSFLSSFIVEIF